MRLSDKYLKPSKFQDKEMLSFFRQLFIRSRFFGCLFALFICFVISFFFESLYGITWILVYVFIVFIIIDILLLFLPGQAITAERKTPEKLSNGDENTIELKIRTEYHFPIQLDIIDEIPFQFQVRDFLINKKMDSQTEEIVSYQLRPVERGEYYFGALNIYAYSPLGLLYRRFTFGQNQMTPTYPSYIQLRKYDLIAFSNHFLQHGLKKIRRIGYSMEFEQIKEYVAGDDIRQINWKATAKKNALMINQFQTERSQNIYMIIDKGRVMRMPFHGLALLDYAINSTLVLSNIILKKDDKAGMMTFSRKIENRVLADKKQSQMGRILESLYNIQTDFKESDFSRLYMDTKKYIGQRSLILLYTNFETMDGLTRQLPYLKAIAANHLLVVVFFQNTELFSMVQKKTHHIQEIYDKTIAEKFIYEKKLIVNELRKYGIYSLLTKPEDLTLSSINTYLEIKARGLI